MQANVGPEVFIKLGKVDVTRIGRWLGGIKDILAAFS